jgi:hypothetical protein
MEDWRMACQSQNELIVIGIRVAPFVEKLMFYGPY